MAARPRTFHPGIKNDSGALEIRSTLRLSLRGRQVASAVAANFCIRLDIFRAKWAFPKIAKTHRRNKPTDWAE